MYYGTAAVYTGHWKNHIPTYILDLTALFCDAPFRSSLFENWGQLICRKHTEDAYLDKKKGMIYMNFWLICTALRLTRI